MWHIHSVGWGFMRVGHTYSGSTTDESVSEYVMFDFLLTLSVYNNSL